MTAAGTMVTLPDLRIETLMSLRIQGVPLRFRSDTILHNCLTLIVLSLINNELTQSPSIDRNVELLVLDLSENKLTQSPTTDAHTALVELYLHNNLLTQGPALGKNIATTT